MSICTFLYLLPVTGNKRRRSHVCRSHFQRLVIAAQRVKAWPHPDAGDLFIQKAIASQILAKTMLQGQLPLGKARCIQVRVPAYHCSWGVTYQTLLTRYYHLHRNTWRADHARTPTVRRSVSFILVLKVIRDKARCCYHINNAVN